MNRRLTIQIPLVLCIALLLIGCAKEVSIADQAAEVLVVESTLEVGFPISDVHIHGLRGVVEGQSHSDLQVELNSGADILILTPVTDSPGYYEGPSSYLITPETTYTLSVAYGEEPVMAETTTPPNMGMLSSSKDHLDAEVQGDLVFLEWTGVNTGSFNEFFYVIELIPLDDDAEAILRFSEDAKANNVLAYTSEATLSINDFNFFGPHSIKVYAISKDFESLFAPQSNSNENGPSNILNGYGYFIGASVIEGSLEIR